MEHTKLSHFIARSIREFLALNAPKEVVTEDNKDATNVYRDDDDEDMVDRAFRDSEKVASVLVASVDSSSADELGVFIAAKFAQLLTPEAVREFHKEQINKQ